MAYDNNIYARIVSGDVSEREIEQLKLSGEWDEIQKILKVTESFALPDIEVDEQYEKLSLRKDKIKKTKVRSINMKSVMSIAALFIVLLGAGWLFAFNSINHIAPNGEVSSIVLPDESVVKLNDGSKIKYNRFFTKNRVVHLEGEGLFEVKKGSSFIVKAKQGEVRVLGTVFNMKSWSENLQVECYEGRVEVVSGEKKIILNAGERIDLNLDSQGIPEKILYTSPDWMNGESRFSNRPILEVLSEIERQFDVVISTEEKNHRFSGKFDHDNIEEALDQVCKPYGLKYNLNENKKVVISK